MADLISFQDAIQQTEGKKRHLILGNGFSIACRPNIFRYDTLFNQADFSESAQAKELFDILDTRDFEEVINTLEKSAQIIPAYDNSLQELVSSLTVDANTIKHLLVDTVANSHPARPNDISDKEFWSCRKFLSHFLDKDACERCSVYSLNYDLLLYWTLMHKEENDPFNFVFNDGFNRDFEEFGVDGEPEFSPDVTWQSATQSHTQNIHFLHGALHLYDEGSQLRKYTWVDSGVALTDQARYSIENGFFPLFVSEGTSEKKMDKILHSAYLHKCYRSFVSNINSPSANFYTFGYSFSSNDDHISRRFEEGKFKNIYMGLYGDIEDSANQLILQKVEALRSERSSRYPLEIHYYDASTAKIWGE
jgi:hypothetical protein